MTKIFKCLLSALLLISVLICSSLAVSATEVPSHELSIDITDDYVVLNGENAKDNAELIESLGYTVESFENYLKPTDNNTTETLFLAINPSNRAQVSVKTWSTEFSKKVGDFYDLSDDALAETAKELITTKGASYKTVHANGMKFLEVRSNDKDSGGDFCSVQYITVRNNKFYATTFTFAGKLDDQKVQSAWDMLITLKIETQNEEAAWDFTSIMNMVFLVAMVIIAVVVAGFILNSIIKDIKRRRTDAQESADYITRRK